MEFQISCARWNRLPRSGPKSTSRGLPTSSDDARYPAARIFYPYHPWFGDDLEMIRVEKIAGERYVRMRRKDTCQLIPRWMTDPQVCARCALGVEPVCSWNALVLVHAVLGAR